MITFLQQSRAESGKIKQSKALGWRGLRTFLTRLCITVKHKKQCLKTKLKRSLLHNAMILEFWYDETNLILAKFINYEN